MCDKAKRVSASKRVKSESERRSDKLPTGEEPIIYS